jgi:DNA polymerase alpha subunit B
MADTVTELRELFSSASPGELEVDVLTELQSIMRLHNIPPQELFFKWEAYSMKLGDNDMKLNIDTARGLKQDVQDSLERENRSKAHHRVEKRAGATPRHVAAGDVFGMLDGLVPNTPRVGTDSSVAGSKRKANAYHTPSISRIKQEPASSPPQLKTPYKPDDKE